MATFVLVPGAWLGGWCWRQVAGQLRSAGHDAVAITLTGVAERAHLLTAAVGLDTHVDDVVGVFLSGDLRDAVLVGHSYGGTVITAAAARVRERLRGLVYLDASVPMHGESNNDVLPPRIAAMVRERARKGGDGWRVPRRRPSIGVSTMRRARGSRRSSHRIRSRAWRTRCVSMRRPGPRCRARSYEPRHSRTLTSRSSSGPAPRASCVRSSPAVTTPCSPHRRLWPRHY